MIMMWRCCGELLPLLVFFPSILYGLVTILWLTDENQEVFQTLQWSCVSDGLDSVQPKLLILYLLSMHLCRNMSIYYIILHIMLYFILYIRTYIYTHTFLPLFMYCYFYYVHLFLENDSIFSNCFITYVFGIIG